MLISITITAKEDKPSISSQNQSYTITVHSRNGGCSGGVGVDDCCFGDSDVVVGSGGCLAVGGHSAVVIIVIVFLVVSDDNGNGITLVTL